MRIELDNRDASFSAGETVTGKVVSGSMQDRNLQFRVGWIVSNDKMENVMAHAASILELDEIENSAKFSFILPSGPISYTGELFELSWLIEVSTKDRKKVTTCEFELVSD